MTDLIERLKYHSGWNARDPHMGGTGNLLWEAIDELERLRNEIAQYRSQAGDSIELQEAEQRGFLRGLAHARNKSSRPD